MRDLCHPLNSCGRSGCSSSAFRTGFKAVGCNANNLQVGIFRQLLKDTLPPIGKIIYHENTDNGLIADNLSSCLEFKTKCANWCGTTCYSKHVTFLGAQSLLQRNLQLAEAHLRNARTEETENEN